MFTQLNFTADVNTSAPRTSQINVVNDVANYTGPHEGAEFRGYPENILSVFFQCFSVFGANKYVD